MICDQWVDSELLKRVGDVPAGDREDAERSKGFWDSYCNSGTVGTEVADAETVAVGR